MAYVIEAYIDDFNLAYNNILTNAKGNATIYDDIIKFIDVQEAAGELTKQQSLNAKIQVMTNFQTHMVSSSQNIALQLVDKKYKFDKELAMLDAQIAKVNADTSLVTAQEAGITQQVVDNRKIKALNSLSNTYGVFGSGGITMSTDMWTTYFSIVGDLAGTAAPASTTVAKV